MLTSFFQCLPRSQLDQEDTPESTYQATFDTSPDGDWTTVHLPWHDFVPVKRAQSDPKGAPLDPSRISKFGLVLSRFEFNKMPNPSYKPGPFALEIAGGIGAFTAPRPQLLVVGSAGVERNAIIGDDAEARKKDIPIIQLNPGGVLNYKYDAEVKARASGFPYCVVRCTGEEWVLRGGGSRRGCTGRQHAGRSVALGVCVCGLHTAGEANAQTLQIIGGRAVTLPQ